MEVMSQRGLWDSRLVAFIYFLPLVMWRVILLHHVVPSIMTSLTPGPQTTAQKPLKL